MKDFELSISPVETYKAPEVPVLGGDNSALLKKLPLRWRKNAKILACLGIVGTLALAGCSSEVPYSRPYGEGGAFGAYYAEHGTGETPEAYYALHPSVQAEYPPGPHSQDILDKMHDLGSPHGSYSGYSDAELTVRLHQGGMGVSSYVVHLTEQDAYGIIRARLEAAGLNFDAVPPDYTIDSITRALWDAGESSVFWGDMTDEGIRLNLFDRERNVAVSHISWDESNRPFSSWGRAFAMQVERTFTEHMDGITVGAIYNPGAYLGTSRAEARRNMRDSHPELVRSLINQVDAFIFILQYEGILEPYPNVDVIINGTPMIFGEHPALINNHKMVPVPEIFEALEMTVETDDQGRIVARKGDISITVGFSGWNNLAFMRVNDEWIDMDIPVIAHNDQILVPLQFVARAIGADVEWDESAREIRITTN